jgi:phenylacetate-CoA ligase
MAQDRKTETRRIWLETLAAYKRDPDRPGSRDYWSPSLDTAPRDELIAIQNAKLVAVVPFLFENSPFYRRRFERLGMIPTDIQSVEDLPRWPVIDKKEMIADTIANPPYGTYCTMDDETWRDRGWMMFSSSGTTGAPRVFRYSQIDRDLWAWADARALHAMGIRHGETVFLVSGYGLHVWAWGNLFAFAKAGIPVIPGGGMDARARAMIVAHFNPTVLACTPSYALHLGRTLQSQGIDPAKTAVRTLFVAGEPSTGIPGSRERLESLWNARIVENYGCTEASPHVGGFTCAAHSGPGRAAALHLFEDIQIWELVDPTTKELTPSGARGLAVCTNLNSESSPQLRFLVGDFATLETAACACGRTHVRAVGAFTGRSDDLLNLRGIKMYASQIEEAIRAVPEIGDEFEIVLSTTSSGLDVMTVRVEHADAANPQAVAAAVAGEIRARCEIRANVEVLRENTLPKTEFKAKRVRDTRAKN